MSARFDKLFESLPTINPNPVSFRPLTKSVMNMDHWSLSLGYIGFTAGERRREHQYQIWLTRGGFLPKLHVCDICLGVDRVGPHAEDYYNIWSMSHVCFECHRLLHKRFSYPKPWEYLVSKYTRTREEWFWLSPRAGDVDQDFASYLRRRFGNDYAQVEVNSARRIPVWARDIPSGLYDHDTVKAAVQASIQFDAEQMEADNRRSMQPVAKFAQLTGPIKLLRLGPKVIPPATQEGPPVAPVVAAGPVVRVRTRLPAK